MYFFFVKKGKRSLMNKTRYNWNRQNWRNQRLQEGHYGWPANSKARESQHRPVNRSSQASCPSAIQNSGFWTKKKEIKNNDTAAPLGVISLSGFFYFSSLIFISYYSHSTHTQPAQCPIPPNNAQIIPPIILLIKEKTDRHMKKLTWLKSRSADMACLMCNIFQLTYFN